MHPTLAVLLLGMLASAFVVGSVVGLGTSVRGVRSWAAIVGAASVVGGLFGSLTVRCVSAGAACSTRRESGSDAGAAIV